MTKKFKRGNIIIEVNFGLGWYKQISPIETDWERLHEGKYPLVNLPPNKGENMFIEIY